jgi:hypothetical protein
MRKGEQASRFRAVIGGAIASGIIITLTSMAFGQVAAHWPMGGQNVLNSRSQSVTTITPQNVGALKLKWVFTTKGNVSATPAVYDHRLRWVVTDHYGELTAEIHDETMP